LVAKKKGRALTSRILNHKYYSSNLSNMPLNWYRKLGRSENGQINEELRAEPDIAWQEVRINEGIPTRFLFTELPDELHADLEGIANSQGVLPSMEQFLDGRGLSQDGTSAFSYWWYVTSLNHINMRNFSSFGLLPEFSEENPLTYILTRDPAQMRAIAPVMLDSIPDWAESRKIDTRMLYDQRFFYDEAMKYRTSGEIPLHRISGAVLEMLYIPRDLREQKKLYDVLFLCAANVGRSQMAEGFYNHLAGGPYSISAASLVDLRLKYNRRPHPGIISVMEELGIDISPQWMKLISTELVANCHKTVSLYSAAPGEPHFDEAIKSVEYLCSLYKEASGVETYAIRDPGSEGSPLPRRGDLGRYRQARDAIHEVAKRLAASNKNNHLHDIQRQFGSLRAFY